jgi:[ribosomal protein S18]-alanine N-acetyltransferase
VNWSLSTYGPHRKDRSIATTSQAADLLDCAPMTVEDLAQVNALEMQAFSAPRSAAFYRQEVTQNQYATYRVLRSVPWQTPMAGAVVIAYGGYWLLGEEAHIVSIAVDPQWRRRGLAEWLMLELVVTAQQQGAVLVTLEMRTSNLAANALYHKLGFQEVGRRKRYYRDNNEDAILLSFAGLQEQETQLHLTARLQAMRDHFGAA